MEEIRPHERFSQAEFPIRNTPYCQNASSQQKKKNISTHFPFLLSNRKRSIFLRCYLLPRLTQKPERGLKHRNIFYFFLNFRADQVRLLIWLLQLRIEASRADLETLRSSLGFQRRGERYLFPGFSGQRRAQSFSFIVYNFSFGRLDSGNSASALFLSTWFLLCSLGSNLLPPLKHIT